MPCLAAEEATCSEELSFVKVKIPPSTVMEKSSGCRRLTTAHVIEGTERLQFVTGSQHKMVPHHLSAADTV